MQRLTAVVLILLRVIQAEHLRHTYPSQCPRNSDVFRVPAGRLLDNDDKDGDRATRVAMTDYPSTGSTWLMELLRVASKHTCSSPACSIYTEDGGRCHPYKNIHCPCDWGEDQGAMLFKTHFPAQEIFSRSTFRDWQYNISMRFDKMLLLVRHPVATIKSNLQRWGGDSDYLSGNLHCWGEWWNRARREAGHDRTTVVRYEDLCEHTSRTVYEVLQFLGGCYGTIDPGYVRKQLEARPDLACIYTVGDLEAQTTAVTSEDRAVIRSLAPLFAKWGYKADGSEWRGSQALMADGAPGHNRQQRHAVASERNPWHDGEVHKADWNGWSN